MFNSKDKYTYIDLANYFLSNYNYTLYNTYISQHNIQLYIIRGRYDGYYIQDGIVKYYNNAKVKDDIQVSDDVIEKANEFLEHSKEFIEKVNEVLEYSKDIIEKEGNDDNNIKKLFNIIENNNKIINKNNNKIISKFKLKTKKQFSKYIKSHNDEEKDLSNISFSRRKSII